jgi:DNA/RNA-binding domain of Phe-tRNA-synthetase-like protein
MAPELESVLMLGVLACEDVHVGGRSGELDAAIAATEAKVRALAPADTALVRTMYHRLGLDPTRTRPSSEALLRRVRKGDALPRINTLVDICNWCSLELQVPYGLYDRAVIEGAIELRRGLPGEEYAGIRKDSVHLDGRMTLADGHGPFGNPSADSLRTSITEATTSCLAVIFSPRAHGEAWVLEAIDLTSSRLARFAGGREVGRWVVT